MLQKVPRQGVKTSFLRLFFKGGICTQKSDLKVQGTGRMKIFKVKGENHLGGWNYILCTTHVDFLLKGFC